MEMENISGKQEFPPFEIISFCRVDDFYLYG